MTITEQNTERFVQAGAVRIRYHEAGEGEPLVLLHGGGPGASGWSNYSRNVEFLSKRFRVLIPDLPGFGGSGKSLPPDRLFTYLAGAMNAFLQPTGVDSAHFVGNSLGAVNMFVDATSEAPLLPARSLVMICGGGEIQRNEHSAALYDYDATLPGMRRIVEALFHDPAFRNDDEYVQRRYESSIAPGAWEALAAARFRRPGLEPPALPSSTRAYERITVPTLVVEGECDKLLPQLVGRDRQADLAGPVGRGRAGRPLSADRTTRRRQRAALGISRRRDSRKDGQLGE